MNALLRALSVTSEARRFRRLTRAIEDCYPGKNMKLVEAGTVEIKNELLKALSDLLSGLHCNDGPIFDRIRAAEVAVRKATGGTP